MLKKNTLIAVFFQAVILKTFLEILPSETQKSMQPPPLPPLPQTQDF